MADDRGSESAAANERFALFDGDVILWAIDRRRSEPPDTARGCFAHFELLNLAQAVILGYRAGLFGHLSVEWVRRASRDLFDVETRVNEERLEDVFDLPPDADTLLEFLAHSVVGPQHQEPSRDDVTKAYFQTSLYFLFDELKDESVDGLISRLLFSTDSEWSSMMARVHEVLDVDIASEGAAARTLSLLPAWVAWGPGYLRSAQGDIGKNLLGIGSGLDEDEVVRRLTAWHIDPTSTQAAEAVMQAFDHLKPSVPVRLALEWVQTILPRGSRADEWNDHLLLRALERALGPHDRETERSPMTIRTFSELDPVTALVACTAWRTLPMRGTRAHMRFRQLEEVLVGYVSSFRLDSDSGVVYEASGRATSSAEQTERGWA